MYQSLADIQAEKAKLNKAISDKEDEISKLWDEVFHPAEEEQLFTTPTQKILKFANTGAGILDGALLGWKLYKRIGGSFSSGRKRRRK